MKTILSKEQIRTLIQKPSNQVLLDKALLNEKALQHFYDNSAPELIYAKVRPLLTAQKFSKFKEVYKNHSQTVVDRIKKHYRKVFTAPGRQMVFDFGTNTDLEEGFQIQRRSMFEGTSDNEYFKETASKLALTQPNSIYVVGTVEADGEEHIRIQHVPLKNIHDVKADVTRIRYCIIKQTFHDHSGKKERFFVYDDVFFSVWIKSSSGVIIDPTWGTEPQPHNNSECPVTWVYDDNMSTTNNVFKKSVYNDSLKDMYEYNIIKTFYQNYKYFGAFGKEVKTESRCTYNNIQDNVKCDGRGTLSPTRPDIAFNYPLGTNACPSCKGKNKGVMGEIIEVPIQQQGNVDLLTNYQKLNYRIEADSTILQFHKDDEKDLKQALLIDVIGEGYGQSYKGQALNEDQVASNFDDQETNLNYFKDRIEKAWGFCLDRAGEIYAPESFVRSEVKLGNKYFLKPIDQLYQELEALYKGTNNSALIEQKQQEILLTENKNDINTIKRYELVRILKPFNSFPLTYIENNRQALSQSQPKAVHMFDNFDQVMAIFEHKFGKVESIIMDEFNSGFIIKNLLAKFNEILVELNPIEDVKPDKGTEGS